MQDQNGRDVAARTTSRLRRDLVRLGEYHSMVRLSALPSEEYRSVSPSKLLHLSATAENHNKIILI